MFHSESDLVALELHPALKGSDIEVGIENMMGIVTEDSNYSQPGKFVPRRQVEEYPVIHLLEASTWTKLRDMWWGW